MLPLPVKVSVKIPSGVVPTGPVGPTTVESAPVGPVDPVGP